MLLPMKAQESGRDVPYYNLEKDGGTWNNVTYTTPDGVVARDCFFCDGTYTYYLQYDGTPMKNQLTYHPDGEHIIYFNESGQEVFYGEHHIERGVCGELLNQESFFDPYGYMLRDEIVFNVLGNPNYYDYSGALVKNRQCTTQDGNIVIATASGALENNSFQYDAFGRIVFCHWNGMIAKGLITDGIFYYHMDEVDGHFKGCFPAEGYFEGAQPAIPDGYTENDIYGHCSSVFEMRILGDNEITKAITDWNSAKDTSYEYLENSAGTQYWRLSICKDALGNVRDNITGQTGTYMTLRGIQIGTDRNEVKRKYGIPSVSAEDGSWDWYMVGTYLNRYGHIDMWDQYIQVKYGIRFYYDDNGNVNEIVYQKYPPVDSATLDKAIREDIIDVESYYRFRDVLNVNIVLGEQITLDASKSMYATEGSTYQWCNGKEWTPIEGEVSNLRTIIAQKGKELCLITNPDGKQYEVVVNLIY